MQCRSHSRRRTSECLFLPACSMDEYAEEKRTEKNLIVRSVISEAEATNNKRLRSTFCIEAIQTRSIARPLCDSRASCTKSQGNVRKIFVVVKWPKTVCCKLHRPYLHPYRYLVYKISEFVHFTLVSDNALLNSYPHSTGMTRVTLKTC